MRFYDCYVFDLDGTLYRGTTPIDGAAQALAELRKRGAAILFFTNNSGLTLNGYVEKLSPMGFEVHEDELLTSGVAAAQLALSLGYKSAFVVGEPGLIETVRANGLRVTNDQDQIPDVVISGICRASLSYNFLSQAMQCVRAGADYIACNADATYPVEGGFQPGSGAIVAFLETCMGRKAKVAGKPNPAMLTNKLSQMGIDPKNALVVGDRFDTDIECGRLAGCDTVLVLSGVQQTPIDGITSIGSVKDLV